MSWFGSKTGKHTANVESTCLVWVDTAPRGALFSISHPPPLSFHSLPLQLAEALLTCPKLERVTVIACLSIFCRRYLNYSRLTKRSAETAPMEIPLKAPVARPEDHQDLGGFRLQRAVGGMTPWGTVRPSAKGSAQTRGTFDRPLSC